MGTESRGCRARCATSGTRGSYTRTTGFAEAGPQTIVVLACSAFHVRILVEADAFRAPNQFPTTGTNREVAASMIFISSRIYFGSGEQNKEYDAGGCQVYF